ncbi:MAG: hypothetical protein GY828_07245 [Candidatus Gracilibacteria bacterium]|nr:hypothetical protein [Candidatus Gracilibacteria bacterium]
MKELLEKFFGAFTDGISLLKADKSDEAIKKFEEASEMKASITKEVSKESLSEENIEKYFETDKGKESIKTYVDMYMSSNDVSSFMDQIKELTGDVEKIKKEKENDDKTVSEALDSTIDRVGNN